MYRWDRITIKEKAKTAVRNNYWRCVLVAALMAVFTLDLSTPVEVKQSGIQISITPMMAGVIATAASAVTLIRIFLTYPLQVGGSGFFIRNAYEEPTVGEILNAFSGRYYLHIVWVMFLRDLKIFLWSLLFVIPGIIKSYEYKMVPYLLAEHPEWSTHEIYEASRSLMMGEKLNTFVLDFSFLPWDIAGALTLGVLNLFWVNPYREAAYGELYLALSQTPENFTNPW